MNKNENIITETLIAIVINILVATLIIKQNCLSIEQRALKNVNNCLNTNIYSYLEMSGGQSYNFYLNVFHFLAAVLIRHLWQLKTVVFLHCCVILAVLLLLIFAFKANSLRK